MPPVGGAELTEKKLSNLKTATFTIPYDAEKRAAVSAANLILS